MVDPGERFEENIGRAIKLMRIILRQGRFTDEERARRQSILDELLLALDDWSRLDLPIEGMSRERLLQHEADVLEAGERVRAAVDRCKDFVMQTNRTGGYNGERSGGES
ncbi:hypothetical protein SH467x_000596 [Pirellulaceae bacterium SH467]